MTQMPYMPLALTSFGVRFDLSTNRVELLRDALFHLPLQCKRSSSASLGPQYSLRCCDDRSSAHAESFRLYRNGRLVFECADRRDFLERFSSIITLYVAETSSRRTFVHAGVVGWKDYAILIPGRSFAGKTTLVAELVRAGAIYYSDEFAVVDKRGMVHSYPRPLHIREDGCNRQTPRPVEELGGITGSRPLQAGLVIVSRYKPDGGWRPQPVSPGVGLLKLLDNTVSARNTPAIALATLKKVVSNAHIVRGVRGEASQVVEWMNERFGCPGSYSKSMR